MANRQFSVYAASMASNFMAKQAVDVEHQVEQAFCAAREGEFGHILPTLGPRVVPLLAPYLHDDQADIRRESEGRFQVDRQPPL